MHHASVVHTSVCSNPVNLLGRFSTDIPVLNREKTLIKIKYQGSSILIEIKDTQGDYHIKLDRDVACRKFLREPLRGTTILCCGCGMKLLPLRGTNYSKTKHLLSYFFLAQCPNSYRKRSRCEPFEANNLRGFQLTAFSIPKRYDKLYGRPPPPPPGETHWGSYTCQVAGYQN